MTAVGLATGAAAAPRVRLPSDVRDAVIESLLLRVPRERIVAALAARGYPEAALDAEMKSLADDPVWQAAWRMSLRHVRLSTLLGAMARQAVQPGSPADIPVRDRIGADEFYDDYYFANRPVVIQGLVDDWPALSKWTPEFFGRRFGSEEIEVTADRASDPRYEDHFPDHCRLISMAEFVARITNAETNDVYLVGKNHLLDRPAFASLWDDFTFPEGYLDAEKRSGLVHLWLGPAGTVTPLHHDDSGGLLFQVTGRKVVRLIAPCFTELVYNDRDCFSAVDLEAIDDARFPNMRHVRILETQIGPGDVVFIPLGWWHWVKSLTPSVSLSMRNWAIPGRTPVWTF